MPAPEIYTLSLHDALPICRGQLARRDRRGARVGARRRGCAAAAALAGPAGDDLAARCRRCRDRKSTRLNSSHLGISYAVFCLKKKKTATLHSITVLSISIC